MANATYRRLDEVLRALHFSFRGVHEQNNVYIHDETGALIAFPEFPADEEVLPRHLLMVRTTLDAYGIAAPPDFAEKLQPAS